MKGWEVAKVVETRGRGRISMRRGSRRSGEMRAGRVGKVGEMR